MPPESRTPCCSGCCGREGGKWGSGQAVGLRRAPGCGRCLELLTPAAWLPSASQSSNKRGRRRGEEEEPGGSAAPFTQQPKPGQAARAAPWGRPRRRGGGGSEGASLSETPSSSTQHALSAGRCGTTLPPPPLLGLRQCGSLVSLESPFRILVGAGRGRAPVRTPGCPLDRLGLLRLKRWEEFPAACGAKKKVLSSGAAVGGPRGPYRKSPYDPHGSTCPEAQATLSQRWGTDVLLQSQGAPCLSLLFFLVGNVLCGRPEVIQGGSRQLHWPWRPELSTRTHRLARRQVAPSPAADDRHSPVPPLAPEARPSGGPREKQAVENLALPSFTHLLTPVSAEICGRGSWSEPPIGKESCRLNFSFYREGN
ncbi:uncharacterized protein LOC100438305 [Pongo abelii]|uniref:uncharacterized protein LOC100438305 n=1 Tax=Pongo abelii TaxID=9601 RepID=UPI000CEF734C|nr:uncharacterized protein LOC100438305 [Pongo abelii]